LTVGSPFTTRCFCCLTTEAATRPVCWARVLISLRHRYELDISPPSWLSPTKCTNEMFWRSSGPEWDGLRKVELPDNLRPGTDTRVQYSHNVPSLSHLFVSTAGDLIEFCSIGLHRGGPKSATAQTGMISCRPFVPPKCVFFEGSLSKQGFLEDVHLSPIT
jgi:hypothetical protein